MFPLTSNLGGLDDNDSNNDDDDGEAAAAGATDGIKHPVWFGAAEGYTGKVGRGDWTAPDWSDPSEKKQTTN